MDILIIIFVVFTILSRFTRMIQEGQKRRQEYGGPQEGKPWKSFDIDWKEFLEQDIPKEERRVKTRPRKAPNEEGLSPKAGPLLSQPKASPGLGPETVLTPPKGENKPSIEVDFSPQGVMQGIIMQEILQPPRALRKMRR